MCCDIGEWIRVEQDHVLQLAVGDAAQVVGLADDSGILYGRGLECGGGR